MNPDTLKFIEASIKTIPDYPKPGILFRDITSLIENAEAFKATIDLLAEHYRDQGITKIVGTEARGFIFGAPVAFAMGLGFVPVRKPGKLPRAVIEESYALEYGTDTLQLHTDAIVPGDKVLVVDDLLATGGTVDATVKLIRRAGGEVADAAFIISLPSLGGDAQLSNFKGEFPALGLTFDQGKGSFVAQPDGSAKITAQANSGKGTLYVDGGLSWFGDAQPLQLKIHGENVLLSNTSELRIIASTP